MKKIIIGLIALAIVATIFVSGYAIMHDQGKTVAVVDVEDITPSYEVTRVMPSPTPLPEPHAWSPKADPIVNYAIDHTDLGHLANGECGWGSETIGFEIPSDLMTFKYDGEVLDMYKVYPYGVTINCSIYNTWQFSRSNAATETPVVEATATPTAAANIETRVYDNGPAGRVTITTTMVEVTATSEPMTDPITNTQTADGEWRVELNQDLSYGPELGHSRPGYGTSDNEIGIAVGVTLTVKIDGEEVTLGNGCQQIVVAPNSYARDAGGTDWGFRSYVFNPEVTQAMNELVVLNHEWARAQIEDEDCPELSDDELLVHTYVFWQDENRVDHLQPWQEYRRASGENNVIMLHPSDLIAEGWHCGYGDSSTNQGDDGSCRIEDVSDWGWIGGGVIHPWDGHEE